MAVDQNSKVISKSLNVQKNEIFPPQPTNGIPFKGYDMQKNEALRKPITDVKENTNGDNEKKYVKKVRIIRDIDEDHTNFQNNILLNRNEL